MFGCCIVRLARLWSAGSFAFRLSWTVAKTVAVGCDSLAEQRGERRCVFIAHHVAGILARYFVKIDRFGTKRRSILNVLADTAFRPESFVD